MKSNRIIQLYNALIRFISIRQKAESHNVFPVTFIKWNMSLVLILHSRWIQYSVKSVELIARELSR